MADSTPTTQTTKKGNGKKAVIFGAIGAGAGFGASKLFKTKKVMTVVLIVSLAAVASVIGYKS